MIETVRSGLAERGLERGCRFIVTANLLDDMRVHLLFISLSRPRQPIFERKGAARAMCNNEDAIPAEKRAAAVLFVIRLVLNVLKCVPSEIGAGHSPFGAFKFVPEPLKNRHRDRFARFQDHVADKSVAYDNFDRVLEQMPALDVADEVERTLLQHLEDFLGLLSAFHVFFAERYQTNRRTLVAENMARIN